MMNLETLYSVWSAVLLERSIVFVSSDLPKLSQAMLGIKSLLTPFRWCHVMIPVLPAALIDIIDAPVPFLVGISARQFKTIERDRFDDKVVVQLDEGKLIPGSEEIRQPEFKGLKKTLATLYRKFEQKGEVLEDLSVTLASKEDESKACVKICNLIRAAFRKHVIGSFPSKPRYDVDGFIDIQNYQENVIKWGRQDDQQFLQRFVETQMFVQYVETSQSEQ